MVMSSVPFWQYLALASLCMFSAGYAFVTWWQVRGLLGLAMTILSLSLCVIFSANAWAHSGDARISIFMSMAVSRTASVTAALSIFVLADVLAASANSHRALTTKFYLWLRKFRKECKREQA